MFEFQGVWFPDGERHLPEWMARAGEVIDGRGSYQIAKYRACRRYIKHWRRAIDVGGHVGLWSMQMAKQFYHVDAFEPVPAMRECYERNMSECTNWTLHHEALGATAREVRLAFNPDSTGDTHVDDEHGDVVAMMVPLDSFLFEHVSFVKIDCEGYEVNVIDGARETLLKCRPCVIVEQKPHVMSRNYGKAQADAVALLRSLGARQREVISGDYIMAWDADQ